MTVKVQPRGHLECVLANPKNERIRRIVVDDYASMNKALEG